MNYVLDTDTIIYLMKAHPGVRKRIVNINPDALYTTIINHSKLFVFPILAKYGCSFLVAE